MKTIQLYSDETKPTNNNTFLIYSMIYGTPEQIEILNQKIVKSLGLLDANNKGLHSCKLNMKKMNKFSKYENILDILQDSIVKNEIHAQLLIIGSEKNKSNTGRLKKIVETELNLKGSKFNKAFVGLEETDYPALYHRLDHLFLYLRYRDRIAPEGTNFELYPDSSGKILKYKGKKFFVQGNYANGFIDFYRLVNIIGNLIANSISKIKLSGWPTSNQNITKYEPIKSTESYIIQLCDILCNFFYCYLRYEVGLKNEMYELKSNALISRFRLDNFNELQEKFEEKDGDVFCRDLECSYTINFDRMFEQ